LFLLAKIFHRSYQICADIKIKLDGDFCVFLQKPTKFQHADYLRHHFYAKLAEVFFSHTKNKFGTPIATI
ncbi:MAG: hypothetical protein II293_04595, partial [Bacteroidaceae bacterium]|nr:hypothetical protein [Bacteroidaceae bacterium]